ncbi:hypothetical protein CYY_008623 [Polysphondylium violaceum]|uniref:FYVE-type domain-containing protein n=1 Tax=Polysphondylium violaceum TaxID=133409 RepID=A0A8J4PQ44_9MYCE|nr:hypothetical protein CYY_008623 [Polysphondylium violaceum]
MGETQKVWRPIWVPDHQEDVCLNCNSQFNTILRRHHCRGCGNLFCNNCSSKRQSLPLLHYNKPVRICNRCDDLATFSKWALSDNIQQRVDSAKGFCTLTEDSLARKMIIRNYLSSLITLFTNYHPSVYTPLTKAVTNLSESDINRIDVIEANILKCLVKYLLEIAHIASDDNNNSNNSNSNNSEQQNQHQQQHQQNKTQHKQPDQNGEQKQQQFSDQQQILIKDEDYQSIVNVCLCFEYLSNEQNNEVKTELAEKCLPILIKLTRSYNLKIQKSSATILLNLTKNSLTREQVIRYDGLHSFISIVLHDNVYLQEISSQALSILSSSSKYHRKVVESGALPPLVLMLNSPSEKVLEYSTLSLSNLSENVENQVSIVQVGGINPLKNILNDKNHHSVQISINAATTIFHISTNKKNISQLVQNDLIDILVKIVIYNYNNISNELLLLSVKILGNISHEKDGQYYIKKNQSIMNILRIMVNTTNKIQYWASIIFKNCENQ